MIRLALALCSLTLPAAAAARGHAPSPCAGWETRQIKSLSDRDLDDLRAGRGWGLALAAELNGVPGPAHLLELRDVLELSTEQVAAIEAIPAAMQAEAQISRDTDLRGYGAADPCAAVPDGHDPAMWRRHDTCE